MPVTKPSGAFTAGRLAAGNTKFVPATVVITWAARPPLPKKHNKTSLRDHAIINMHLAAGRCGARTRACRVGTRADARRVPAQKRRDASRRCTHEYVRHVFGCEVIVASVL